MALIALMPVRLLESPLPVHPSEHACIDLVNSCFSDYLGTNKTVDRLLVAEWRQWFLARYGLAPDCIDPAPVERLQALRADLRTMLGGWARRGALAARDANILDGWISPAIIRERVGVRRGGLTVRLEPVSCDWTWVESRIAASAVQLLSEGESQRLKVCGNPHCSWVYYDTTLNSSKQYCSTSPCGTLVRVRRFRRAAKQNAASPAAGSSSRRPRSDNKRPALSSPSATAGAPRNRTRSNSTTLKE
jgi:predicted RNA-binding Zn ribbon-like protein